LQKKKKKGIRRSPFGWRIIRGKKDVKRARSDREANPRTNEEKNSKG